MRVSKEKVTYSQDYNKEEANCRGKKRWSWWTLIHSVNIHFDIQLSVSENNLLDILQSAISKEANIKNLVELFKNSLIF